MEDFEPGLLGASPPPPEASFEDVPEEKKRKTVRSFFHKCNKTIRNLFLCGGQDRSRHPSPEPDHKDHEGESSLLPQEDPLISSGHYHPSDLELEDLAFECGYDYECLLGEGCYGSVFKAIHRADRSKKAAIKCITTYGVEKIDDQPTFFAEPAYVWCLAAMFEKIMKACETNEWCYIIRLCLARDPADRLRLDQM
ncbi:hypothetical protein DNTS_002623 [Danionella cerebrum]|uniref:Protein kinase domain-containing protein n=1 Tax=Danionella cerebrum TaxID=2873325 RepID=A0A553MVC5_9TELE|nr:hypothetical protein DNTS_002623 [Danionella translucida]